MNRPLLFALLLVLTIPYSFGQTSPIGLLSKSQPVTTKRLAKSQDNFGLPPSYLMEIKKISDSSVVLISTYGSSSFFIYDTIVDSPNQQIASLPLDSVKTLYQYKHGVSFTGWEKKKEKKQRNVLWPIGWWPSGPIFLLGVLFFGTVLLLRKTKNLLPV